MSSVLLVWLVIGAALIAGEMMTGTFYLLIFGVAAWSGAAAAFLGYGLDVQLVTSGVIALVGLVLVVRYGKRWRGGDTARSADLDVGNDVRVEAVLPAGRLKVHYRGSTWDAVLETPGATLNVGDYGVIRAVRGNTLVVALASS